MKPVILIRTDGSHHIGLGHLVRCIALAHMLKNNFQITFYCKESSESLEQELMEHDFGLIKIRDEEQFFVELSDNLIVVLDGYNFDTAYQRKVKEKGCRLVCIDDLHDKEFMADLIINHAPGVTTNDYKAQFYTKFALGLEYALLRPAFLEQAKKSRTILKIENVLICFGGSDIKNLTQRTLNAVIKYKEFKKIVVITGPAYQISEDFIRLIKSDKRINHRHALNEKQMLATMFEAELAIVQASGILFEALAAGCIVISGYYVDNQLDIYQGFYNKSVIMGADDFSLENLKKTINEALERKTFYFSKVIDGLASERFVKTFKLLAC